MFYLFSRYSISLIGSSESNFQLLLHTTTAFSKSFMVPFPNMTISLIRSNILAKKKAPKTELAGTLTYSLLYSVLFKITFVFLYYWNILICKLYRLLTWCVIFRIWYPAKYFECNSTISEKYVFHIKRHFNQP